MNIRDIIFQQQKDKDVFLGKDYIERDGIENARKSLNTGIIKVITGPRRSGKSVFGFQLLKGEQFFYLNFDDENLLKVNNYDKFIDANNAIYKNNKNIFFDEIQNLEHWEIFVNKLHRRGYNLVLTGSNSRLLSGELASNLTGRYLTYTVLPFSFNEFLRAKKEADIMEYFQTGGFPEVVVNNIDAHSYLQTLFQSVLLKDIVKRYNLRSSQQLYDLSFYLINNIGVETSFNRIKEMLSLRSVYTVQKYVNYLVETFFFFVLNRFSFKVKEQIKSPKKIYLVDNGFIKTESVSLSPNTGKLLENLVFVELLRRGEKPNLDLFSYLTRNRREVDFVVKKGVKVYKLIQVCYALDAGNKKREIRALIEASSELRCNDLFIITFDQEETFKIGDKTIQVIPLSKWLTDF